MDLTNEQKRKILADAPMGAEYALIHKTTGEVDYGWSNVVCGDRYYKCKDGFYFAEQAWHIVNLIELQKEVDAEEKAKALFDLRQSFMDTNIDWKDPDECVRDIYRNMIKAGVVIDEKAAKYAL